jgi:hypothetical protein
LAEVAYLEQVDKTPWKSSKACTGREQQFSKIALACENIRHEQPHAGNSSCIIFPLARLNELEEPPAYRCWDVGAKKTRSAGTGGDAAFQRLRQRC